MTRNSASLPSVRAKVIVPPAPQPRGSLSVRRTKRANLWGSTGSPRSTSILMRWTVPRPDAATRPGTTTSTPLPRCRTVVPTRPASTSSGSSVMVAFPEGDGCGVGLDGEGLAEASGPTSWTEPGAAIRYPPRSRSMVAVRRTGAQRATADAAASNPPTFRETLTLLLPTPGGSSSWAATTGRTAEPHHADVQAHKVGSVVGADRGQIARDEGDVVVAVPGRERASGRGLSRR